MEKDPWGIELELRIGWVYLAKFRELASFGKKSKDDECFSFKETAVNHTQQEKTREREKDFFLFYFFN